MHAIISVTFHHFWAPLWASRNSHASLLFHKVLAFMAFSLEDRRVFLVPDYGRAVMLGII